MHRTLLYLPIKSYRTFQNLSRKRGKTLSLLLRNNLVKDFEESHNLPRNNSFKFFEGLIEVSRTLNWKKVPKDLSQNIDAYLYGEKSKFTNSR